MTNTKITLATAKAEARKLNWVLKSDGCGEYMAYPRYLDKATQRDMTAYDSDYESLLGTVRQDAPRLWANLQKLCAAFDEAKAVRLAATNRKTA